MKAIVICALIAVAVASEAPVYRSRPAAYPKAPVYDEYEPEYRPESYKPAPEYKEYNKPEPYKPEYKEYNKPEPYKPSYKPTAYTKEEPEYKEPYAFGYAVKDEYDDYGRQEESDGKVVSGSYHVALPDGRRQIVTYKADPYTGFTADVKYEGEAHYPEEKPYVRPSYKGYKEAEPEYRPVYKSPQYKDAPAYEKPVPEYRPRPAYPAPKY